MARLLLMLACARVAAGVMDALDIKAVCEVPTDGGPRKIYLDMDAEAFETLAGPPGPGNSMSLPIETSDCEPFKSAYINFSPGGHPAWDGKGDGYGIDHFGSDGKTYDNSCLAEAAGVEYVDEACQAVHVLQKFYTDENCENENTALTEAMYPQNNLAPDGFTDPSYQEGTCSELVGPLFSGDIVIPFEHSGKLRCGPGNCEATLDWYVGSKTCDGDISRVESMTFTFPPDATDGTMSACVVTNGAGSDEECSVGGQACSRAIQYHEFLPDQTPWHIHEYCACN